MDECDENIDEEKLTEIDLFEHKNKCVCYYSVFIILTVISLTICIGISTYFVYYKYMNRNNEMYMIMFIKQKIINIKWD